MNSSIDTTTAKTAVKLSDLSISNDSNDDDEITNTATNTNGNANINNHVTNNTNATIYNNTCTHPNKKGNDNNNGTNDRTCNDNIEEEEEERIPGIRFVNYRDESDLETVMRLVGRDLSEPYSIFTYRYFLHRFPDLCIFAVPCNDNDDESGEVKVENAIGCVVCKIDEETVPPSANHNDDEDDTAAMTVIQEMGGTNQGPKTKTQHQNPDDHDDNVTMLDSNHHNGKINDKSQTPTIIKSGYMAMLAVDESCRRSGIGTALVERAVRRMKKRGCRSVTLETEVSNEAAMRLYEDRLGFIREELLVRYYLNWGDAYRLRLWFDS